MNESAYLFDVNLWVALAFPVHPHHAIAKNVFTTASESRPAVFCRATQHGFLRIASTPAVLKLCGATGHTNKDAWTALQQFMDLDGVIFRDEPPGLVPVWRRLSAISSASPKVWMDAYLAAFAIAGEHLMVTLDRDFKSFKNEGLKLLIPGESG